MAKIGEKAFTPTHIEDSDYTKGDKITKGIKITTKETFTVDGEEYNKLHTTRVAVMNKLGSNPLRLDINEKNVRITMKCIESKTLSDQKFYKLVDV